MPIISVIGLLLIIVGAVVLFYEEGQNDYKNPNLIKVTVIGIILGAILLGIGLA